MFLFCSALAMVLVYFYMRRDSITTMEVVTLSTLLFGYAGFNVVMGNKDKENPNKKPHEGG